MESIVETPKYYENTILPFLKCIQPKNIANMEITYLSEIGNIKQFGKEKGIENYLYKKEGIYSIRDITKDILNQIINFYNVLNESDDKVLFFHVGLPIPFICFSIMLVGETNNPYFPIYKSDSYIYYDNITDYLRRDISLKEITFEYYVPIGMKNILKRCTDGKQYGTKYSTKYSNKYIKQLNEFDNLTKSIEPKFFNLAKISNNDVQAYINEYISKLFFYTTETRIEYEAFVKQQHKSGITVDESFARIFDSTPYTFKVSSDLGYFEVFPNIHHSYKIDKNVIKEHLPTQIKEYYDILHYMAFFYTFGEKEKIMNIRDLNQRNILVIYPLVLQIRDKLSTLFDVPSQKIRIIIQAPNVIKYSQLHVHFTIGLKKEVSEEYQSREKAERKFGIHEVYNNVMYLDDFYKNKTFYYLTNESNFTSGYPTSTLLT